MNPTKQITSKNTSESSMYKDSLQGEVSFQIMIALQKGVWGQYNICSVLWRYAWNVGWPIRVKLRVRMLWISLWILLNKISGKNTSLYKDYTTHRVHQVHIWGLGTRLSKDTIIAGQWKCDIPRLQHNILCV